MNLYNTLGEKSTTGLSLMSILHPHTPWMWTDFESVFLFFFFFLLCSKPVRTSSFINKSDLIVFWFILKQRASGGISVERLGSADVYTDTAAQAYSTVTTRSSVDVDLNHLLASKCPVCLPYISETVLSATARVYRMHVDIFNTMHKATAPHIKAFDCSEQLNAPANARKLYVVR